MFRCGPAGCNIKIVCNSFSRTKVRKCPGMDGMGGGGVIKALCLATIIFLYILRSSLEQRKGPSMWKEFIVVLVVEVSSPKAWNHYGPMALMFLVMKTIEHLVKIFFCT